MKLKTISGHYDTAFDLSHNNRDFVPGNVDVNRIPWNYNCVAAGKEAYLDPDSPRHIQEFWNRYKEVNKMYWTNRSIAQTLAYEKYRENMQNMCAYCRSLYPIPHNLAEAFVTLLLLPLLVPCGIYLNQQQHQAREEWEAFKTEQWLRDLTYKATRISLRDALYNHDAVYGTRYLRSMDHTVKELGQMAQRYEAAVKTMDTPPEAPLRFVTLEGCSG